MILPLPYLTLLVVILAIAALWWWLSRTPVAPAPAPVAIMTQRIAFPGGIHLHDPKAAVAALEQPDEIVIPHEHAVLVIDYPLSHPALMSISAPLPLGFTRSALVKAICEEYAHVYDAEEGTAATKTIPIEERGAMRSRNRTDGAYGIWGHDLQDLVLTAAHWTRQSDGTVRIGLHVES
ncbi:MAG TPA: hypothetical protein VFT22_20360 [Kofleriaceae bacterium]|nr:hypothetical protein [Kofleriaceae bacterium]